MDYTRAVDALREEERRGDRGHPRDYSDFKGLVFGICRRHKRTATLNWMSFGFIDFTIAVAGTAATAAASPVPSLCVCSSPRVSSRRPDVLVHIYIYI